MDGDNNDVSTDINFFIEAILKEQHAGYGFNFLLGSGISYQSGVMLGREIIDYLCFVYYKLILEQQDNPQYRKQSVVGSGWPEIPSEVEKKRSIDAIVEEYKSISQTFSVEITDRIDKENGRVLGLNRRADSHKTDSGDGVVQGNILHELSSELSRPLCPQVIPWSWKTDIVREDEILKKLWVALKRNSNYVFHGIDENAALASEKLIREAGLRAMYDWRAILEFLARLRVNIDRNVFELSHEVNQDVIDGFNRFMVGNRKPNQNHYLIAHLARPLRTRKLFTTNFDTLTEDAFRRDKQPLKVVSLEMGGHLPFPDLLRPSLALLKLHGETRHTRADFSIGDNPTERDKGTFIQYLWPRGERATLPSHMIVLGSSLSDKRIFRLILDVLEKERDFKVFVFAARREDQKRMVEMFNTAISHCINTRVFISPPGKPEYALYELFQRLTLSLPPGGFFYQFDQYLPPSPMASKNKDFPDLDEIPAWTNKKRELVNLLFDNTGDSFENKSQKARSPSVKNPPGNSLVFVGHFGVTRAASNFFHYLSDLGKRCVWFELEDFSRVEDLAAEIIRSILYEIGKFQLEHVIVGFPSIEQFSSRLERYIKYTRIVPENWVIFIYGRNLPGECAGFNDNAWCDQEAAGTNSIETNKEKLKKVITTLNNAGFRIVYLPLDESRAETIGDNWTKVSEKFPLEEGKVNSGMSIQGRLPLIYNNASRKHLWAEADLLDICVSAEQVVNMSSLLTQSYEEFRRVLEKLQGECGKLVKNGKGSTAERKRSKKQFRYMYTSTLFRQSRHLSALISDAVIPCENRFNTREKDNDLSRARQVLNWRQELASWRIIYRKPGGYVWKYGDIRKSMQLVLEYSPEIKSLFQNDQAGSEAHISNYRSSSHLLIAEWYFKAFLATGHPTPLMEAMYHWSFSIRTSCSAMHVKHTEDSVNREDSRCRYRYVIIVSALCQINKALFLARNATKHWMYDANSEIRFSTQAIKTALGLDRAFPGMEQSSQHTGGFSNFSELVSSWLSSLLVVDEKRFSTFGVNDAYVQNLIKDLFSQSELIKHDLALEFGKSELNFRFVNAGGNTSDIGNSGFSLDSFAEKKHQQSVELHGFETREATLARGEDAVHELEKCISEMSRKVLGENDEKCNIFNNAIIGYLHSLTNTLTEYKVTLHSAITEREEKTFFSVQRKILRQVEVARKKLNKNITQLKIESLQSFVDKPEKLLVLSSFLSDVSYVYVKWAKMIERTEDRQTQRLQSISKSCWVVVTSLCSYSLELLKHLPRRYIDDELTLRAKCLSLYGLALGRLGRFCEAHRRLNEASAMDFNFNERIGSSVSAAVVLRRAEIYLCEAENHLNRNKYIHSRKYIALLDDTFVSLKKAEHLLSGISHSSLWWGRLHMLRLKLYAEYSPVDKAGSSIAEIPLMYREKRDYMAFLKNILSRGVLVSPNNAYRRLCFLHHFIAGVSNASRFQKAQSPADDSGTVAKTILESACEAESECKLDTVEQYLNYMLSDNEALNPQDDFEFKGYAKKLYEKVRESIVEVNATFKVFEPSSEKRQLDQEFGG